jgi:hypothetical protein
LDRAGDQVDCRHFQDLPCSAVIRNRHSAFGGFADAIFAVNDGQIHIYHTLIADNSLFTTMFNTVGLTAGGLVGRISLNTSVVVNNEITRAQEVDRTSLLRTAEFGLATIQRSTIAFSTPLDAFLYLNQLQGQTKVEASILASSAQPPPSNVIPTASAPRLTRENCGFFQTLEGFAEHQVVPDPTLGHFVEVPASSLVLDPIDHTPQHADLIDVCGSSGAFRVDFLGDYHPYAMNSDSPVHGDIGAIEAHPPEFGDGFESAIAH